jgi:hypothetical protein
MNWNLYQALEEEFRRPSIVAYLNYFTWLSIMAFVFGILGVPLGYFSNNGFIITMGLALGASGFAIFGFVASIAATRAQ